MAAASFLTLPKPFLLASPLRKPSTSPSSPFPGLRRNALKINALAQKFDAAKVVPQADRVLIRLEPLPEQSAGGVLLPKSAVKFERYLVGEVLSVGAEVSTIESGKKVLFSDINAYEVSGTKASPFNIESSDYKLRKLLICKSQSIRE
ncbi:10 kDa chaperonin 2, chloroplastic [Asimina triloba]